MAAIPVEQVKEQLKSNMPLLILDVRTPEEFTGELGHISQAMNVPVTDLSRHELESIKTEEIVTV